mmetsp:Transcript_14156/g.28965  ORF Transcript_14156/g.28965 Transcript_14156/m.28965 type:complete len:93 (+) Transcript_14156:3116-3394(+)
MNEDLRRSLEKSSFLPLELDSAQSAIAFHTEGQKYVYPHDDLRTNTFPHLGTQWRIVFDTTRKSKLGEARIVGIFRTKIKSSDIMHRSSLSR